MKRLTKEEAKTSLKSILTALGIPRQQISEQPCLTHCKFSIGSGFVEVGYEWFENKMKFFAHFNMPKRITDVEACANILSCLLARDEKMEVYFNGNLNDDMNNGLRFDNKHKVTAKLPTMGAEYIIAQEIKVLSGKGKWSYLGYSKQIDYDFLYQTL